MSSRAHTAQERQQAAEARRDRRAAVTDPDVVMQAAAAFLAVRPRSVEEARRRLHHLGYPPGLCDEVIGRLVQLGYLDDLGFARAWVESRDRAKPRGAAALRREMQLKGVPEGTIAQVLADRSELAAARAAPGDPARGDADRAAARKLLDRRAASLQREADPRRRRQKAYALLARGGFAPDICHDIASTVAEDDPAQGPSRV